MSIIGMHALIYSNKADETRRFFSDVLGFRSVDAGRGWPIFAPMAGCKRFVAFGRPDRIRLTDAR